jgi:hypothetical protein
MQSIDNTLLILVIILCFVVYFIPTVVSALRHKRNTVPLFLVNLFLGWSGIGWLVVLVWSLMHESARSSAG